MCIRDRCLVVRYSTIYRGHLLLSDYLYNSDTNLRVGVDIKALEITSTGISNTISDQRVIVGVNPSNDGRLKGPLVDRNVFYFYGDRGGLQHKLKKYNAQYQFPVEVPEVTFDTVFNTNCFETGSPIRGTISLDGGSYDAVNYKVTTNVCLLYTSPSPRDS